MLFPLIRRLSSARYLPQQQHRLQQSVLKTIFSFVFFFLKNTSCNIVKRCSKNAKPLLDSRNYDDEEDEPKKVSKASRQLQGGGETFSLFSFPHTDANGEGLFDVSS